MSLGDRGRTLGEVVIWTCFALLVAAGAVTVVLPELRDEAPEQAQAEEPRGPVDVDEKSSGRRSKVEN